MSIINHQNNFSTNLTSATLAGATTTPLNSIPSVAAPFYIALDATNLNSHYEVVAVTSKTATNINHAATTYAHTTSEEVRMVIPATEMDGLQDNDTTGWFPIQSGATLAYSSADDPTYVVTTSADLRTYVQVGDRVKFTNNFTTFYGIVTATAAGTLTLYGGTDYDVANSAITSVYFSHMKSPVGFPLDPTKWTITVISDTTERSQASPVAGTWYNLGSLTGNIHIGSWSVEYFTTLAGIDNSAVAGLSQVTLSTANNSESDADFTSSNYFNSSNSTGANLYTRMAARKYLTLASKTAYYLNAKTTHASQDSIRINPAVSATSDKTIVRAICAYL